MTSILLVAGLLLATVACSSGERFFFTEATHASTIIDMYAADADKAQALYEDGTIQRIQGRVVSVGYVGHDRCGLNNNDPCSQSIVFGTFNSDGVLEVNLPPRAKEEVRILRERLLQDVTTWGEVECIVRGLRETRADTLTVDCDHANYDWYYR